MRGACSVRCVLVGLATLVGLAVSLGSHSLNREPVYPWCTFKEGCLFDSLPRFLCFRSDRPAAARCTVESDFMKHPLHDLLSRCQRVICHLEGIKSKRE